MADDYKTFEMNVSDKTIPVIPFGSGNSKSFNISDASDAHGVGLVISRVDKTHRILEDKTVVEDDELKPYVLLYFQKVDHVDVLINALNIVRERLKMKSDK